MIDVEGDAKWNVLLMGNPLAKELSGIALNVLANFQQKEMIMDGLKVRVAESVYWIQPKKG